MLIPVKPHRSDADLQQPCGSALSAVATPGDWMLQLESLESEIRELRETLAQAQAELARTQAGERQARRLALHDGLTQLPNRRYFIQRLDEALLEQQRPPAALALMFLDLDGFKRVNDRHGHAAGDEVLRIVGIRLSRAVRAADMVSRLGGDEFGCLPAGPVSREQLLHLAAKLFDAVSAPMQIGTLSLSIRPSIGMALHPGDGSTAAALMKNADFAMYEAKRRGTRYEFAVPPDPTVEPSGRPVDPG